MNIDFDPEKAFKALDSDRDGFVSYYDIYQYMREVLAVHVSLSEAEALIKEYDGDLDRRLGYREFLNFVLPATSAHLRDIAIKRTDNSIFSASYKYAPVPYSVKRQLGELIDKELRFGRSRTELVRDVNRDLGFICSRSFDTISRGRSFITVDDLIYFLDVNGYRPITADLEAILRRCDHTGDQMLSYTEFTELTSLGGASTLPERPSYHQSSP
jgi:Ca2+-binding EF-hand superfamily protein